MKKIMSKKITLIVERLGGEIKNLCTAVETRGKDDGPNALMLSILNMMTVQFLALDNVVQQHIVDEEKKETDNEQTHRH